MRRHHVFHGFIGQALVVGYLERIICGCKTQGQPFIHLLLCGSSGFGKTKLARALATAMKTALHVITAGKHATLQLLATLVQEWSASDIVFIDEAHNLPYVFQEALFKIIDEHKAPRLVTENGKHARVDSLVDVPPVSIVLATDQPGKLLNALRKRCRRIVLSRYSIEEMIAISRHAASSVSILLSPQAHRLLAEASYGCPRHILHQLEDLRAFYATEPPAEYTKGHVRTFLTAQGIDSHARTPEQRDYMHRLYDLGQRGGSLHTLTQALGLDSEYVLSEIEPQLVWRGWLAIMPGGRVLTPAGRIVVEQS